MDVAEATLLDAALRYAERGIPVFPIRPRGKTPLTIKGFKDASIDPAVIKAWWQRWPDANIGIPTGAATFGVVDVDVRHGGDVAFDQLREINGGDDPINNTPLSLTGGGGFHYCFAVDRTFRNSAGRLGPGIDTRGDGGYIVAPPSIHESDNAYQWEGEHDFFELPLSPLPDWLHPEKSKPPQRLAAGNLGEIVTIGPGKATGDPVAPGGRNVALASLAGQWVQAGDSLHEVMAKAAAWNTANPTPLPGKEMTRTVASVVRTHVRNHPAQPVPVTNVVVTEPEDAPAVTIIEEKSENLSPPTPKFPAHLLTPPGLVGKLCSWINETAYKRQPIYALANALAFCGALFGRKVRTPRGLRTNLYMLGVGPSCSGKEHSRNCIKSVCQAAGLTPHILGGEEVSSDSAILQSVADHPSILFQWDEIGHMLAAANSRNAQTHQRAIPTLLTKLFTSAKSTMLGKEYANRTTNARRDIVQPNVCLYGTAEPRQLFDGLTPDQIVNGFFGRMIVLQTDDPDPFEQYDVDPDLFAPPAGIVEMCKEWWLRDDMPQLKGNLEAVQNPQQHVVICDPDAEDALREFNLFCREQRRLQRSESGLDALWGRAVENAHKIAMTFACGEGLTGIVISEKTMRLSVDLVKYCTSALVESVRFGVAGSEHERNLLYVHNAILGKGGKITQSELSRRTRRLGPRARKEVLDQLIESGEIRCDTIATKGRGAVVYVAL